MRHYRYLSYVIRYKWFVLLAGFRVGAPLWRLLIHDWSKFLPSEWVPYVDYFHRRSGWEKDQEYWRAREAGYSVAEAAPFGFFPRDRFLVAWNRHQCRNPHHWQYWLHTEDSGRQFPIPMPEPVVREMVADWMGAGRAITGRWEVAEWYAFNRHKMKLSPATRDMVEALLEELSDAS